MTWTVGSLFSGIGGIDLGLERAGMKVIWQAETDPYASAVLRKHWPDVPNLGDVAHVDWAEVERPTLVAGGFPCQPVSAAGRREGQADKRWLWPLFANALRQLRPRVALLENVPGLLTAQRGRAAQEVFGDLAKLGFDCEWASIPAAAVGAPHLRYRLFVVAHAAEQGLSHGLRPGECSADAGGFGTPQRCSGDVAHAEKFAQRPGLCPDEPASLWRRRPSDGGSAHQSDWWAIEPDVGRMANGVPRWVDRLKCLGNAVVPQVTEWVGRQIMSVL